MIGNITLEEHFKIWKPEQCIVNIKGMIKRVKYLNPKIYLEIGCAGLGTFRIYESLLPPSPQGLAIGVDTLWDEKTWRDYRTVSGCDFCLINKDSKDASVKEEIVRRLDGRKIDFLFIDGDHSSDYVKHDWSTYSPLVRQGGMVAFHDYDVNTRAKDRVGKVVHELVNNGYKVTIPEYNTISTAVLYI